MGNGKNRTSVSFASPVRKMQLTEEPPDLHGYFSMQVPWSWDFPGAGKNGGGGG